MNKYMIFLLGFLGLTGMACDLSPEIEPDFAQRRISNYGTDTFDIFWNNAHHKIIPNATYDLVYYTGGRHRSVLRKLGNPNDSIVFTDHVTDKAMRAETHLY